MNGYQGNEVQEKNVCCFNQAGGGENGLFKSFFSSTRDFTLFLWTNKLVSLSQT